MWGIELVVMCVMIAFNSVFAAFEIALASISAGRLHALGEQNKPGAKAAEYMKTNLEGSLAGVQLGITLVGAVAAAVGGAGAEDNIAPQLMATFGVSLGTAKVLAIVLVVAPLTVVTIIFGELVPKVFALRNKERVLLRLSQPMKWFVTAVRPLVWVRESSVGVLMRLGERHLQSADGPAAKSEAGELHELRAMASMARTSRLIGPQEEKIIHGAAALSSRPIRDVMLPAEAISMLGADDTLAQALVSAHLDLHTRFPLTEVRGDPQRVIGYVNFKDIVAQMRLSPTDPSLRAVMRAIPSLPADTVVSAVLEKLTREGTHIALVCDPAGKVVGMVTLEDIIEELVGDIEDEFDRLPQHVVKTGAGWVVGGGASPARLLDTTGIVIAGSAESTPVRHLSDWVVGQLPDGVHGGETIERDGVRVVVRKVRRQKVQEALVQVRPKSPA